MKYSEVINQTLKNHKIKICKFNNSSLLKITHRNLIMFKSIYVPQNAV